jgi:hypothetical protein
MSRSLTRNSEIGARLLPFGTVGFDTPSACSCKRHDMCQLMKQGAGHLTWGNLSEFRVHFNLGIWPKRPPSRRAHPRVPHNGNLLRHRGQTQISQ